VIGSTLRLLLFLLLLHAPRADAGLLPRTAPEKPIATALSPADDPRTAIVKFSEGTRVRIGANGVRGAPPFDARRLADVLRGYGLSPRDLAPLFRRAPSDLDAERDAGQRQGGRALADLNLYYRIALPADVDTARLCDALNRLPFVERAAPARVPEHPPGDIAPPTPDLTAREGHLAAPPWGVGWIDPALVPGADGAGSAIADVEFGWFLGHEDLGLDPSAILGSQTPLLSLADHGSAVLGVLRALPNEYGVDGIAPAAALFLSPVRTDELGVNAPNAISVATAALARGGVLLVELQDPDACALGAGPVEWDPAVFDAIAAATAKGIAVIEPAGNGGLDLDAPECEGRFVRPARDSGAIFVGAGDGQRRRLPFSDYGSRLDVQGWGHFVATLGYGDAFDPGDARQRYTTFFGGTSGASAIVAGVSAAVQGARITRGQAPFAPNALRHRLVAKGSPQSACDPASEPIGPLPSLPALLNLHACSDGLDNDGDGRVDFGADPGCANAADRDESNVEPSRVALRSGDLVVVDDRGYRSRNASTALWRVDPDTGAQTLLVASSAIVDTAQAAFDRSGRLLVADFTSGALVANDLAQGAQTVVARCLGSPWGVAVARDGRVYVTATDLGQVREVDPATGASKVISSGEHVRFPRGIAVAEPNDLYVSDSSVNGIVRVDRTTGAETVITRNGFFVEVRGVAIDGHGDLLVADIGSSAIVRVSPATGQQTLVSSLGHLDQPRNIAVDRSGRIFVAEDKDLDGSGSVLRIDPAIPDDGAGGNQTVVSAGGGFEDPFGIAVVP
jgi:serine protease